MWLQLLAEFEEFSFLSKTEASVCCWNLESETVMFLRSAQLVAVQVQTIHENRNLTGIDVSSHFLYSRLSFTTHHLITSHPAVVAIMLKMAAMKSAYG